jgi:tetratricopeptide (TPR) repeat protein
VWSARLHRRIGTAWDEQNRHQQAVQSYDTAEIALGEEPAGTDVDWWREWLEIQHRRMWRYYGLNRSREMAELAEKTQPVVEQHGTPLQRGAFYQGLTLLGLRKDRYQPSEETVAYARTCLDAYRESGNLNATALSQSGLGFTLLWRGKLDEAEKHMQAGLEAAERMGNVIVQARNLTYLTVLYRQRGQVEAVRRHASRSLDLATARQMLEYMGLAYANLAWVAWREGNLAAVGDKGQAALEMWQKAPLASPFQWTALLPLMAVDMAHDRIPEAIDHAQSLLDPSQQRLPDALAGVVEGAVVAWEAEGPEVAASYLDRAIRLAQELGYL